MCKDVNISDCYVGSTTDLVKRRYQHKNACNNSNNKYHNCYVYQFIRQNGNFDNWIVLQIEPYECKDKYQLLLRGQYWIEQLNATLNKQVQGRNKAEYYVDNKDKIKQYYVDNKNEIHERMKQYRIDNKDKIRKYYESNKIEILEKNKK